MDLDCPLVTPEVNLETLVGHRGIIANPNCVAILACVAIAPLQRRFGLRRLQIATYQAASGAGQPAMEELAASTRAHLAGEAYPPQVLRHPYAFNLFSHDAEVDPQTGYNGEELKVIAETRRILGSFNLPIGVTCVRVPVLPKCWPRPRALGWSMTATPTTSLCRSRRRGRATYWWAASGATWVILLAVLWRCSWRATNC
jgi:aspartate-semialdehyde dehydrogenase